MFWLLIIISYLLGSISFAILLCKLTGKVDPRSQGSGNPGATNMLRNTGITLAILTLIGDLSKGVLPALLAKYLNFSLPEQAWIGLSAVIGHLYPIYFHFQGGKGVATATGMLIVIAPPIAIIACCIWALTFYKTRTSSQSALFSLIVIIILCAYFQRTILYPMLVLSLLVFWRHRRNLYDLFIGHERHF